MVLIDQAELIDKHSFTSKNCSTHGTMLMKGRRYKRNKFEVPQISTNVWDVRIS